MDPIILGLLLGGGAGLLKSAIVDKPKEDRARKLAAETQRYSPWTGLQAQQVHEADPFGSALQYGTTGAMIGYGLGNGKTANTAGLSPDDPVVKAVGGMNEQPPPGFEMPAFGGKQNNPWSQLGNYRF